MAKIKLADGSQIGSNIGRVMADHGTITGKAQLARATGISPSTIGRIIRGEAMPSADYLARIAQALGVSVQDLHGGASPMPAMRPILAWEHPNDLPEGDFVMIPGLGVRPSTSRPDSIDVVIDTQDQPQAFRADWIRRRNLRPSALAWLLTEDDSMAPRIQRGDSLVVDTVATYVQDGRVYALWYDGGLRVKRLYRLPGGGLRIQSDNAAYTAIDLGAQLVQHVRILGRVVHVAGEGGL